MRSVPTCGDLPEDRTPGGEAREDPDPSRFSLRPAGNGDKPDSVPAVSVHLSLVYETLVSPRRHTRRDDRLTSC